MAVETDAFMDLVEKCLEGTATPEEQHQVVAAAEASAQLRAELVEALDLDARIRATRHRADELVAATMDALLRRGSSARFARRVSEQIERAAVRDRKGASARPGRWRAASLRTALAVAAAAVVLAGIGVGMMHRGRSEAPSAGPVAAHRGRGETPSAALVAVHGRVLLERGDSSTQVSSGADIFPEDRLQTAEGARAVLQYLGEPTRIELAENTGIRVSDQGGAKRLLLERGLMRACVAPQPAGRPMVVLTAQARVEVIGTRFTLSATAEATRIEVTAGLVRLTRPEDNASVNVPAGHRAAVSRGSDLLVESIRDERLLLDLDFEDGRLPGKSIGTVVKDPSAATSGLCVAGVWHERGRMFRVRIENADGALFTYRQGAVLSFDYWVREQTGAIDVYFWNDTRRRSPGFTIWKPVQERWTRVSLRLSEFNEETRDGDLILNLTIQTTRGGNELFVDNIRVEVEDGRPDGMEGGTQ